MNAPGRKRTVRILGVPMDLGQAERGTDVGPAALRYAGLRHGLLELGYAVEDSGNLNVPVSSVVPADEIVSVIARTAEELCQKTREALKNGEFPLTLGGDHSVAIGSLSGVALEGPVGVVWVDAHGDFNTPETSPSGNVHGMPLAVLLGKGDPRLVNVGRPGAKLEAQDVALIGIRQLDQREREVLRETGIHVYTMRDIDERGISEVAREALSKVSRHGRIHVSFDVDALDPREAPGVATPVAGGLSYREAHLLLETVNDTGLLCSMDVVEVNPMLDRVNQTAKVAVQLVLSALGRTIY